jgi:hypothetical protein
MGALRPLHPRHNSCATLKLSLQAISMRFAGAKSQSEGLEANGMFSQKSGFHGKKPLMQRRTERSKTMVALPVRSFCTAEVYHSSR